MIDLNPMISDCSNIIVTYLVSLCKECPILTKFSQCHNKHRPLSRFPHGCLYPFCKSVSLFKGLTMSSHNVALFSPLCGQWTGLTWSSPCMQIILTFFTWFIVLYWILILIYFIIITFCYFFSSDVRYYLWAYLRLMKSISS